jgi:thioester reductase-like protein
MEVLSQYELWQDTFRERIVVMAGDLSEPGLGMSSQGFARCSEETTTVLHCGASVHAGMRYDDLRRTNVVGTKEILRLSTASVLKPLHYISTFSTYGLAIKGAKFPAAGAFLTDHELGSVTGYVQSKWVAEQVLQIARSRGVPVTIYRPGRIWGATKSGAGPTDDLIWLLLKASIEVETVPDIDFGEEIIPVDHLSKTIVQMVSQPSSVDKSYNLISSHRMSSGMLCEYLSAAGYRFKLTDYAEWRQRLVECADKFDSAARILQLLPQTWEQSPKISDSTDASPIFPFIQTDSRFPAIDSETFERYLKYYRSVGFIPDPAG